MRRIYITETPYRQTESLRGEVDEHLAALESGQLDLVAVLVEEREVGSLVTLLERHGLDDTPHRGRLGVVSRRATSLWHPVVVVKFVRKRAHHTRSNGGYELTAADKVWNRAALECGGDCPGEGDRALSALLSVHSVAMNGGLLHSVECHSDEELDRGIAGYEYFGMFDAAAAVAWVRAEALGLDVCAGLEAAERVEAEADRRYYEAVPDDSTPATRFVEHFLQHPEAYAPL